MTLQMRNLVLKYKLLVLRIYAVASGDRMDIIMKSLSKNFTEGNIMRQLILFSLPFMSTVQLFIYICLIFISYILKLICGRRLWRFHLIDFSVFGFLAFLVFGGIVSVDGSSLPKMLLMMCFMGMYLVIKIIINS